MSDQPNALRLADRLRWFAESIEDINAADELRRLYEALQSSADSLARIALDRGDQELADLALNMRAAARGATE